MKKTSAGLLVYRQWHGETQVLLIHPGGPYFRNKDAGAWSIPKGEPQPDEELLDAAIREFQEETGWMPSGPYTPLSPVKQKGGKTVYAFASPGDYDIATLRSSTFELEWPPKSGRTAAFPEVDRAEYFDLETARIKINAGQAALLDEIR